MAIQPSYSQKIILDKFGKQAVAEMREAIRNKKISNRNKSEVNASGRLDKSVEYRLTATGLEILCNEYVYYLIYGRKPSRQAPYQVIRDWIDDKGITPNSGNTDKDKDSMAWAIVKSMANKGNTIYQTYKGGNSGLFSDVFDDDTIIRLKEDLQDAISIDLTSIIFNEYNTSTI